MWSIRAQRHALVGIAGGCLLVSIAVWAWAFLGSTQPLGTAPIGPQDDRPPDGRLTLTANGGLDEPRSLRRAANDLDPQRPLFDPPPKPVIPPPPPPPPRLKLVGTIVGQGDPQAILTTHDGRMIFGRIDQVVENARIAAITLDSVELVVQDQTHVLRVAAE